MHLFEKASWNRQYQEMKSKGQTVIRKVIVSVKVALGKLGAEIWRKGSILGRKKYMHGRVSRRWQ